MRFNLAMVQYGTKQNIGTKIKLIQKSQFFFSSRFLFQIVLKLWRTIYPSWLLKFPIYIMCIKLNFQRYD